MEKQDTDSRPIFFRCLMVFLAFVLLAPTVRAAELPIPPSYANSETMRADAALHGVAVRNGIGLAVGAHGAVFRIDPTTGNWRNIESTVFCQLDDVAWLDDRNAVIVGGAYDPFTNTSRACVLTSNDSGNTWWRSADTDLPRLRHVRVTDNGVAIATGDWSHVALANVFESQDGGRTWSVSREKPSIRPEPTPEQKAAWVHVAGKPVVIRDTFREQESGSDGSIWAVGDHGVILQRRADSQQWTFSRGEQNAVSTLVIAQESLTVPWPLVAREALENRHRLAILMNEPIEHRTREAVSSPIDLVRQTASNVGVSSVDSTQVSAGNARETAAYWMALQQPAVLMLDSSLPRDTLAAFKSVAIANNVERIVSYSFAGRGDTMLHQNALLPRVGILASDVWQDAYALLAPTTPRNGSIAIKSLYDAASGGLRSDSVASGIKMSPGHRLSLKSTGVSRRLLQIAQARLNHEKQIGMLLTNSRGIDEFAKGVKTLLDQAAKEDRQRLAWNIYQSLLRREQPVVDIAGFQETMLSEITARFPDAPLASYARLRKSAIRASEEWNRLRPSLTTWIDPSSPLVAQAEVVPVSPFSVDTDVQQVSANVPIYVPETKPEEVDLDKKASTEIDLNWEFHPLRLLAQDAIRRHGKDGELKVAEGTSGNMRRLIDSSSGIWARLMNPMGTSMTIARLSKTRPRLDGDLSDECWRSALRSPGRRQAIRCAYDEQFVYFAVETPAELLVKNTAVGGDQSVRDKSLTESDRMLICIDTDQDLLTSFQLQFSIDGRTHDSIDGFPEWQPTWYVASKIRDNFVVSEIAIDRRDLVDLPIVDGQSWFVKAKTIAAGEKTIQDCMPRPSEWKRIAFVDNR